MENPQQRGGGREWEGSVRLNALRDAKPQKPAVQTLMAPFAVCFSAEPRRSHGERGG